MRKLYQQILCPILLEILLVMHFFWLSHIFSLFLSDKSHIFTGRIFWSPMISLFPPQIGKIAMCWGLLCSSTMSHALCCDSFKVLLLWISPEVDIRHGSSSTGNFFMPNSSNFLRTFLFLVVPNNGTGSPIVDSTRPGDSQRCTSLLQCPSPEKTWRIQLLRKCFPPVRWFSYPNLRKIVTGGFPVAKIDYQRVGL